MKNEMVIIALEDYQAMEDKIKAYENGGVYVSNVLRTEWFMGYPMTTQALNLETTNEALAELTTVLREQEIEIHQLKKKLAFKNKSFFKRIIEMI